MKLPSCVHCGNNSMKERYRERLRFSILVYTVCNNEKCELLDHYSIEAPDNISEMFQ